MQQDDESSSDSTRKSCLNSPWSRLNYLSSPLQKVMPWKFTYNVTCSFLTNKRQEKGEQEKQQIQSPEFQKRRLEEGICFTGSPWEHPKKWYLCYGRNSKFGRTRAWVTCSDWTSDLCRVARAHGTLEVMLSFQHPFLSQLVFKTYCSHPSSSCLFKASKWATITFCVKPCTAAT